MGPEQIRFSGFIMTYERPEILLVTIGQVFAQTFPPEKILVIDNSETDRTELAIRNLNDLRVRYHRVGYNSGPAGAAAIGLTLLAGETYDWIYWGDDDNPPPFNDVFERLFNGILGLGNGISQLGIIGISGNRFSHRSGQLYRLPQEHLKKAMQNNETWLEVDAIAGNQSMLVNAEVVRGGILPDPRLFFGFEELEFCLRVKEAGYLILASTELWLRARVKFNRTAYRQPIYVPFAYDRLIRQYFSLRNTLIILNNKRLFFPMMYKTLKSLLKLPLGFTRGWRYGRRNTRMTFFGLLDGWLGRFPARKFL